MDKKETTNIVHFQTWKVGKCCPHCGEEFTDIPEFALHVHIVDPLEE